MKNMDRSFFRFVTMHVFDRRTDRILILLDRVCIPCSAVKTETYSNLLVSIYDVNDTFAAKAFPQRGIKAHLFCYFLL